MKMDLLSNQNGGVDESKLSCWPITMDMWSIGVGPILMKQRRVAIFCFEFWTCNGVSSRNLTQLVCCHYLSCALVYRWVEVERPVPPACPGGRQA